jgi:transposase
MVDGCARATSRIANNLFIFMTDRRACRQRQRAGPPPKRHLSKEPAPAKAGVTNGFRSQWGADLFAAIRSVVSTGARNQRDPFPAAHTALSSQPILKPG